MHSCKHPPSCFLFSLFGVSAGGMCGGVACIHIHTYGTYPCMVCGYVVLRPMRGVDRAFVFVFVFVFISNAVGRKRPEFLHHRATFASVCSHARLCVLPEELLARGHRVKTSDQPAKRPASQPNQVINQYQYQSTSQSINQSKLSGTEQECNWGIRSFHLSIYLSITGRIYHGAYPDRYLFFYLFIFSCRNIEQSKHAS